MQHLVGSSVLLYLRVSTTFVSILIDVSLCTFTSFCGEEVKRLLIQW